MKNKIIVALDVDDFRDARSLVDQLVEAELFKVGLESFLKYGNLFFGI